MSHNVAVMNQKRQKSIRSYRNAKLMTQEALAEKSGLSRKTIGRCETSNSWPRRAIERRKYQLGLGLSSVEIESIEYLIASKGN